MVVNLRVWVAFAVASMSCVGSVPAMAQEQTQQRLIDKYCVKCHDQTEWKGGLALDSVDLGDVSTDAKIWEKVVRKLRSGLMPPAGKERPDQGGYDSLIGFLETSLDKAAAGKLNPGRTATYHRLNRAEYANSIRDLLALEIDPKTYLPSDQSAGGFDNNGDILSVTPLLMDRYLLASRQISSLALGDPNIRPMTAKFDLPKKALQEGRASEDLPFSSRGGLAVRYNFPLDGEYGVKIRLQKTSGIDGPRIMGLAEPHQLDVRVDGQRVKLFIVGGDKSLRPDQVEASLEARFPAKAGLRKLTVAFMDEALAAEDLLRPPVAEMHIYGWGARSDSLRDPGVESVALSGPFNPTGAGDSPSRARIFVCHPRNAAEEPACAAKILTVLARRAYRRPVTPADLQSLLGFYKVGRESPEGGSFEAGIDLALRAVLVSPNFLFRAERDPADLAPGTAYRVNDFELASRLSFFLWSSIPDDQLLDLAERGRLKKPAVLEQQVRRMMADPRSKSLVDNFFGQWLGLRNIRTVLPDTVTLPDFDDDLRQAFEQEMNLFLASAVREDRSVVELLSANYTFVNARLARHYGIPNIHGDRFQRVTLADENRWGLLGKGSILTLTSQPNRTSPVLRGKWVLQNILGSPPPPPAPNVPPFPEVKNTGQPQTVRHRLEQHRSNPVCAACHAQMDPLGFAFENFDPIGKWRQTELTLVMDPPELPVIPNPIDNAGTLPDGSQFHGPIELRKILLSRPYQFANVVTEKLLAYATGRAVEYYDQPAIRNILHQSVGEDYRWSSIILGIVKSAPFQMRMSAETEKLPESQKTLTTLALH